MQTNICCWFSNFACKQIHRSSSIIFAPKIVFVNGFRKQQIFDFRGWKWKMFLISFVYNSEKGTNDNVCHCLPPYQSIAPSHLSCYWHVVLDRRYSATFLGGERTIIALLNKIHTYIWYVFDVHSIQCAYGHHIFMLKQSRRKTLSKICICRGSKWDHHDTHPTSFFVVAVRYT